MAEASIAASVEAFAVEPVAWPEVGQFDRLLRSNAEVERNAEAEGSES